MIDTNCVGCGQCAAVCPTGALTVKNEVDKMWNMIFDPSKKTMVQIAPAVRVGIGEEFGIPATQNAIGKIVTALKRMGVDYVFDTSLTADLTIVEESNEFLNKVKTGQKLPLFTSCCPGWIKHIEKTYPEIMPQVSTCGSPMEMFGAILRKQYKDEPFYSVAVMPCSAKKMEAARPELEKDGERLIDLVITSQELIRMIKSAGLDFASLPDTEPDQPLDMYTGGGVIFAVTGGVTEAVVKRLCANGAAEEYEAEVLRKVEDFADEQRSPEDIVLSDEQQNARDDHFHYMLQTASAMPINWLRRSAIRKSSSTSWKSWLVPTAASAAADSRLLQMHARQSASPVSSMQTTRMH